ncbi:MlaD family protein [Jongsikchunia kroppenstedtii]|uniref:MlaD family protein n=1 Tax=Jongsikchunia kroppenstedtii TaxID=1121721 RepID=UPI00138AE765|nr:MlaD family protein [Jongsikchunia kroppenstedtii]
MRYNRVRAIGVAVTTLAATVSLSACSLGPNDLPQPGASVGSGYNLTITFASALNLPGDANVMLNGLRVGEVKSVRTTPAAVDVSVRIKNGTNIPSTTTAEIRQDTVLGDTYIALNERATSETAADLPAGGRIPINQTTSPPQLEDTLAVLANFVNGGNIQRVENTIRKINTVMPNLTDLHGLASTVSKDLQNLSINTDSIDAFLGGMIRTGSAINDRTSQISLMLSDQGMVFWKLFPKDIIAHIGTLLPSVGSIFEGGNWMVPMLDSVATTIATGRGVGLDVWNDSDRIAGFLHNIIIPFAARPSVDVTSVTTPNGQQLNDLQNILRMLGAAR